MAFLLIIWTAVGVLGCLALFRAAAGQNLTFIESKRSTFLQKGSPVPSALLKSH